MSMAKGVESSDTIVLYQEKNIKTVEWASG